MDHVVTPRESQALVDLVEVFRPLKVLEFGSWQGRSALRFLTEIKRLKLDGEITCVDTWLGSAEHWDPTNNHPEWGHHNLRLQQGEPRLFESFKATISEHGFSNRVNVLRCTSVNSEKYFSSTNWTADLTFVDADHSTVAVEADILVASRISPLGNIAGDDWCWPSVQRGILKANRRLKRKILVAEDQFAWVLVSRRRQDLEAQLVSRGWQPRSNWFVVLSLIVNRLSKVFRT